MVAASTAELDLDTVEGSGFGVPHVRAIGWGVTIFVGAEEIMDQAVKTFTFEAPDAHK